MNTIQLICVTLAFAAAFVNGQGAGCSCQYDHADGSSTIYQIDSSNNCESFFVQDNGNLVEFNCAEGTIFDVSLCTCASRDVAVCPQGCPEEAFTEAPSTPGAPQSCESFGNTFAPLPGCQYYTMSAAGQTYTLPCPATTLFDIEQCTCNTGVTCNV